MVDSASKDVDDMPSSPAASGSRHSGPGQIGEEGSSASPGITDAALRRNRSMSDCARELLPKDQSSLELEKRASWPATVDSQPSKRHGSFTMADKFRESQSGRQGSQNSFTSKEADHIVTDDHPSSNEPAAVESEGVLPHTALRFETPEPEGVDENTIAEAEALQRRLAEDRPPPPLEIDHFGFVLGSGRYAGQRASVGDMKVLRRRERKWTVMLHEMMLDEADHWNPKESLALQNGPKPAESIQSLDSIASDKARQSKTNGTSSKLRRFSRKLTGRKDSNAPEVTQEQVRTGSIVLPANHGYIGWWNPQNIRILKRRIRKGIPPSLRGLAWRVLLGINEAYINSPEQVTLLKKYSIEAEVYEVFREEVEQTMAATAASQQSTQLGGENHKAEQEEYRSRAAEEPLLTYIPIIERDLHRTFPDHVVFNGEFGKSKGGGQNALRAVLRCYVLHRPDIGYCQGMALLAGLFLTLLSPRESFFAFLKLLDSDPTLMSRRFEPGLLGVQKDCAILEQLSIERLQVTRGQVVASQAKGGRAVLRKGHQRMTSMGKKLTKNPLRKLSKAHRSRENDRENAIDPSDRAAQLRAQVAAQSSNVGPVDVTLPHVTLGEHIFAGLRMNAVLFATDWYMGVYTRNLPWPSVLRIWDIFLLEGSVALHGTALAILDSCKEELFQCEDVAEAMDVLRNLPDEKVKEETLLPIIDNYMNRLAGRAFTDA
eukprot:Clim_evm10s44 gene=Clim_evmTU10s44